MAHYHHNDFVVMVVTFVRQKTDKNHEAPLQLGLSYFGAHKASTELQVGSTPNYKRSS